MKSINNINKLSLGSKSGKILPQYRLIFKMQKTNNAFLLLPKKQKPSNTEAAGHSPDSDYRVSSVDFLLF